MLDAYGIIIGILSLLPLLTLKFKGKFIYFAVFSVAAIILNGMYLFGPRILYLLVLTYVISTIAELLALKTPLRCFGVKYRYNLNRPSFSSGIRFLNVYPFEASLMWVVFKYLSFNLAIFIIQAFLLPEVLIIFLTPLILVSLDFIVDPVSVNINKLWQWEKGSRYFGIPLRNFLGWYMVSLIATLIFSFIDQGKHLAFNLLYILPIVLYGLFITKSLLLFKLNKKMAIIGSVPAAIWTLFGSISLLILYLR